MSVSAISYILHIHSIIYTTYSLHVLPPGQNYILCRNPQKSTLQCVFETFRSEYFSDTFKKTYYYWHVNKYERFNTQMQPGISHRHHLHHFYQPSLSIRPRHAAVSSGDGDDCSERQRARFNAARGQSGQRVRRMTYAAKGNEHAVSNTVRTQIFKLYLH
jgi:hypothetical protein